MSGAADLRSTLRQQDNQQKRAVHSYLECKSGPSTATYSASQGAPGSEETTQNREIKLNARLIEGCDSTTGLFLLTLQAHSTSELKTKPKRESKFNCFLLGLLDFTELRCLKITELRVFFFLKKKKMKNRPSLMMTGFLDSLGCNCQGSPGLGTLCEAMLSIAKGS